MENGITEEGFLIASQLAVKAGVDHIQLSGNQWLNKKGSKDIFFIEETKTAHSFFKYLFIFFTEIGFDFVFCARLISII